jgi:hypothetical protein
MRRLGGIGLLVGRCRAQRLAEMRKVDSDGCAGKTGGLERRGRRRNLVRVRVFGVVVLLLLRLGVEGRY